MVLNQEIKWIRVDVITSLTGNLVDQNITVALEGNTWTQLGSDINGEGGGDESGFSVSLSSDGSILAIGADIMMINQVTGHVRVYEYSSGSWTQKGSDIDGAAGGDRSGYSVSLSSNGLIVAIGAIQNDGNGNNAGHVRVYEWDATAI